MGIFKKAKKTLVEIFNKSDDLTNQRNMFLKPTITDAFPENPFILAFPRKNMTPKEKIIYALRVDGVDVDVGISALTGLPLIVTNDCLAELVEEKEVIQRDIFYYPKPRTLMEKFDLRNEMK